MPVRKDCGLVEAGDILFGIEPSGGLMSGLRKNFHAVGVGCGVIALAFVAVAPNLAAAQQLGALAPANLAMPRPQAP